VAEVGYPHDEWEHLALEHEHEHDHRNLLENEPKKNLTVCPGPEVLFSVSDANGDRILNANELNYANNFMILMLLNSCYATQKGSTMHACEVDLAEAWVNGILSSIIVSLASLAGALLIPVKNSMEKCCVRGNGVICCWCTSRRFYSSPYANYF